MTQPSNPYTLAHMASGPDVHSWDYYANRSVRAACEAIGAELGGFNPSETHVRWANNHTGPHLSAELKVGNLALRLDPVFLRWELVTTSLFVRVFGEGANLNVRCAAWDTAWGVWFVLDHPVTLEISKRLQLEPVFERPVPRHILSKIAGEGAPRAFADALTNHKP